ncbi:hypothetical protein, partial [Vibrio splendidus]|uniref:hypothetical protein n=1 Tax=Vibrio splendidus TaxID=29497 RepID=UPI003D0BF9F0
HLTPHNIYTSPSKPSSIARLFVSILSFSRPVIRSLMIGFINQMKGSRSPFSCQLDSEHLNYQ